MRIQIEFKRYCIIHHLKLACILDFLDQGEFMRANSSTIASRKIVTAQRTNKKEQFAKHIFALNKSFSDWLKEQISIDAVADLSDGFQVNIQFVHI